MAPASSPESPVAAHHPGRGSHMSSLIAPKTPHTTNHDYRSGSPNYFGLVVDSNSSSVRSAGPTSASRIPKTPSSKGIHTAAAVSPQAVPLSSNPDYDEFKRQLELNRINLSRQGPFSRSSSSGSSDGPLGQHQGASASMARRRRDKTPPKIGTSETISGEDLTVPRSPPKRGLSADAIENTAFTRRQSPADFNEHGSSRSLGSPPLRNHDRAGKTSLGLDSSPPGSGSILDRMASLPTNTEPQTPLMILPGRIAELLNNEKNDVLLLDMRVATQYAQARISGALNLCIPTTLLKRPSYNVHRLADTFKDERQKEQFSRWKSGRYIIVYDQASSQYAEAHSSVNILKKFVSEGWTGQSLIVRGGFSCFSREFPHMVDDNSLGACNAKPDPSTAKPTTLDLPPVMGGCPLPETESAANPFFGNIRQNMDLIGGVGQIPIKCPSMFNSQDQEELPTWLRAASEPTNKGKRVADKFLHIEQREKTRMEEALSGEVVYDKSKPEQFNKHKVKVAGIEKGTKNRYHNILPFEHSRVKLKGVREDDCNYVNANFLQTSLSSKKYIATQSPIPATFADFWSMVWQRDVRVVVMLTAETEGNQIKAHNYWNSSSYGPIKLKLHSEHRASLEPQRLLRAKMRPQLREQRRFSSMMMPSQHDPAVKAEDLPSAGADEPYVVVRKFSMSHSSFPFERMREVTQLHFSEWPDFGVPTHPSHLLGLIEQCNAVVRASANGSHAAERPVVVHCSAGCGRTGTFCTVDSVVDAMKRQDHDQVSTSDSMDVDQTSRSKSSNGPKKAELDLVEQAVNEFRSQRLSMVQSLDQFVMCYETVLEWLAEQKQPPVTA